MLRKSHRSSNRAAFSDQYFVHIYCFKLVIVVDNTTVGIGLQYVVLLHDTRYTGKQVFLKRFELEFGSEPGQAISRNLQSA